MFLQLFSDIPAVTRHLLWRELLHLILGQYVVDAVACCGLWAEVDIPMYIRLLKEWRHGWHSCCRETTAKACDSMQNKCFYNIYCSFEKVLHSRCAVLHCVRRQRLRRRWSSLLKRWVKMLETVYCFWALKSELRERMYFETEYCRAAAAVTAIVAGCCCLWDVLRHRLVTR